MGSYFDLSLFATAIRTATPIALAAMGGLMCQRCGVFNIGLEGLMLIGAFSASAGLCWFGGSAIMGLATAVAFSMLLSLIYAMAVLKLNANAIVASIAINLLGVGLTSYFLRVMFDTSGMLKPELAVKAATITIPLVKDIPVLGELFSGQNYMVYLCMLITLITAVVLYRTHFGLAVRAIGESPRRRAAGIKVKTASSCWPSWSRLSAARRRACRRCRSRRLPKTWWPAAAMQRLRRLCSAARALWRRGLSRCSWAWRTPSACASSSSQTTFRPMWWEFPYVFALVALALSSTVRRARQTGRKVRSGKDAAKAS